MQDYYALLEVEKTATEEQIRKAFRKKAALLHPDKNKDDPTAESKFKEVNTAYQVLSNANKRIEYDMLRSAGPFNRGPIWGPQQGSGVDIAGTEFNFAHINSLFDAMFRNDVRRQRRPPDITVSITIDLLSAINGCKKDIIYRANVLCDNCKGNSAHGTSQCTHCNNKGVINRKRNITVAIPAGIENLAKIKVECKGNESLGNVKSSLYIVVNVTTNDNFIRRHADLITSVDVTYPQLVLGATLSVKTITGELVECVIPPKTSIRHIIAIKNHGARSLRNTQRGNLLVNMELLIPKDITDQCRELLEQLSVELEKKV